MSNDILSVVFENKSHGGGKIEEMDYEEGGGTAFITFEDSSGA